MMILADCAVFIKNSSLFFGMPKFFIFRAVKEHKPSLMSFDCPYCLTSRRWIFDLRIVKLIIFHFVVTTPPSAIRLPPPLTQGRLFWCMPPSRLPPRSVLLLHRGVRRTPAPKHWGGNFLLFTRKGRLSVLRLPLSPRYRRRRKGGNSPRRIFRSPRPVFRLSAFHLKAGQSTPSLSYHSGI